MDIIPTGYPAHLEPIRALEMTLGGAYGGFVVRHETADDDRFVAYAPGALGSIAAIVRDLSVGTLLGAGVTFVIAMVLGILHEQIDYPIEDLGFPSEARVLLGVVSGLIVALLLVWPMDRRPPVGDGHCRLRACGIAAGGYRCRRVSRVGCLRGSEFAMPRRGVPIWSSRIRLASDGADAPWCRRRVPEVRRSVRSWLMW
ncbi:hypothetical protein [Microbacterium sp. ZW T5_56]|uniref:hypothetical protein n=1 Tax=Microbacterium sp. ZW T5_56 TaxID=3378081 RepID=UPI0038543DC8